MPALSTSYLRRKVAQKQLGKRKNKNENGIHKTTQTQSGSPQSTSYYQGERFSGGLRQKQKTQNEKNEFQTKPEADPLKVPATTRGRGFLEA